MTLGTEKKITESHIEQHKSLIPAAMKNKASIRFLGYRAKNTSPCSPAPTALCGAHHLTYDPRLALLAVEPLA